MINNVCVFLGSTCNSLEHRKDIIDLGALLAQYDKKVIYGGGDEGLMQYLYRSVLDNKGQVLGIAPKIFDRGQKDIEIIYTEDIHERKKLMAKISDVFIIMPGGYGTLDELFTVLVLNQIHEQNKPIIIYNDGFWDKLIDLIDYLKEMKYGKQVNNIHIIEDITDLREII